jgi:hypothetical protein
MSPQQKFVTSPFLGSKFWVKKFLKIIFYKRWLILRMSENKRIKITIKSIYFISFYQLRNNVWFNINKALT